MSIRKKAQVAIEFVMVGSLAMIVILVFAGVLYSLSYDYSEQKRINRFKDLGYSLQNELILASEVEPGYERVVYIPNKIEGADFSITQSSTDIVITYKEAQLLFRIPEVSGSLQKGINTISKTDANTVVIS
ncbi:hypothetical protein AYK26_00435 [Euryarchaeota archaeon SM23-78]|nr:MAG: hypothetical protein AYK26_00435 [Euryarchaeota archaeon SM23-78]MBW3001327.1 hypothetical protein [Candidatus Woesearchaeota archaeon]